MGQTTKKRRFFAVRNLSAPQVIVLVFLAIILLGAILLTLPFASRDGKSAGFLTALFTATSATCVTGLSLVDTYTQWNWFGQSVLLILIQIGGLGFMTILSVFFWVLRAKIGLKNRMLLSQSFGLDGVDGIVRMSRHVVIGTAFFELTGALLLAIRFSFDMPILEALRWGLFHSVSAFCNAGFDIMGKLAPGESLMPYATDVTVNITIMLLIVIGGLGFIVWEDIWTKRSWKRLSVYSKLVLTISGALILSGAILIGAVEWNNPQTLGQFSVPNRVLVSAFQSVTTRTAGFATYTQANMTDSGKVLTCLYMIVGGSSGSTAGGVKTVTIGVAVLGAFATLRGKKRLTVFKRTIDSSQIQVASSIVQMMTFLALGGAIFLSVVYGVGFLDAVYETVSAIATVGLTSGVTGTLGTVGNLMLIVFMFFGRIGIMTIGLGFLLGDKEEGRYHYAATKVLIG